MPGYADLMRERAASSGIGNMYAEVSAILKECMGEAANLMSALSVEHHHRIEKAQEEIKRESSNQRKKALEDRLKVEQFLCGTTGLQTYIQGKRSGNTQDYDAFSKGAVKDFYIKPVQERNVGVFHVKGYGRQIIAAINGCL